MRTLIGTVSSRSMTVLSLCENISPSGLKAVKAIPKKILNFLQDQTERPSQVILIEESPIVACEDVL